MPEDQSQKQRVLAQRYRLVEKLGSGGFGTIWRADHLVLEAPVAVKLIAPEVAEDENAVERFLREAKAAAALRSPHVVQILDYGVEEGTPFMVMELLEGETLSQRVKRTGPLSLESTVRFITHVCRAMARAHGAGIVHRDLKPENVFIVENEGDEVAKVLDFGVAKLDSTLTAASSRTRTGSLLGTPYYMSPEQVQGTKEVDHRSDLWSIGVIAYECLTGKKPFVSDGLGELVLQICVRAIPIPSSVSAQLPVEFDGWFEHALQRNPERRFQSAAELASSLRESLGVEARDTQIATGEDDFPSVTKLASAPTEPPPSELLGGPAQASSPEQQDTEEDVEVATVNIGRIVREELARSEADDRSSATVWVALVALILGMVGGGLYLYASPLELRPDPSRGLPSPIPPSKSAKVLKSPATRADAAAGNADGTTSTHSPAIGSDASVKATVGEVESEGWQDSGATDASMERSVQDASMVAAPFGSDHDDDGLILTEDAGGDSFSVPDDSDTMVLPSDAGDSKLPLLRMLDAQVE